MCRKANFYYEPCKHTIAAPNIVCDGAFASRRGPLGEANRNTNIEAKKDDATVVKRTNSESLSNICKDQQAQKPVTLKRSWKCSMCFKKKFDKEFGGVGKYKDRKDAQRAMEAADERLRKQKTLKLKRGVRKMEDKGEDLNAFFGKKEEKKMSLPGGWVEQ